MKITTNNHPRPLAYQYDLPIRAQQDLGCYMVGHDVDVFKYRGNYYRLDEFMRTEQFPGWDGYLADSFFSGILVKIIEDDPDRVIVGRYYA